MRVCVPQVKVAYVNFVNHCYVDTEVEMKEIYTSNHIWKLFEDFVVDMARVSLTPQSMGPLSSTSLTHKSHPLCVLRNHVTQQDLIQYFTPFPEMRITSNMKAIV